MELALLLLFFASATLAALGTAAHQRRARERLAADVTTQLAAVRAAAERIVAGGREAARTRAAVVREREEHSTRALAERLGAEERDVAGREAGLEAREATLAADARALDEREQGCRDQLARAADLARSAAAIEAQRLTLLEERAATSREAALAAEAERAVTSVSRALQRERRAREEHRAESAPAQARRVLAQVLGRYDGVGHLERVQNTVELHDASTLAAIADVHGPAHRALRESVACELTCDLERKSVSVRGDDPLGREIARRVLRHLAAQPTSSAERIRAVASSVTSDVSAEVERAGREAIAALQLAPVHPEILQLVGRLKFRLSYSQNQWKHSLEVARLAALLAGELGADVARAKRGGLLHDIGKAMTHEREGAHAVLGAEVARRCGEDEIVANAIGSHHADEPPLGTVAHLVTAADALSGARPGARRESATQYVSRIREIQAIAARSPAVTRVEIMSAGRDVRISVDALADDELHPLAVDIARRLEEEVTFAGQIRVTVIRESRVTAVAR